VNECNEKCEGLKDFCRNHYRKLKIYGDPLYKYKFTEKHRRKLAKINSGKKLSEEHKKKIGRKLKGQKRNPLTNEIKLKISKAHKGKKLSEEHKKKISDGGIGRKVSKDVLWKWRKRRHSQTTRDKISKAQIGKKLSEEHIQKMKKALKGKKPWNTGKPHPQTTRDKISKSNKGKKLSKEQKKKISLAGKRTFSKGRKQWNTGKKLSEDHIAKLIAFNNTPERKLLQSQIRSKQKFPNKDSKPEIIVQSILKKNNIKFKKHVNFKLSNSNHQADLLIESDKIIEVFGDYWHFNPKLYDAESIQKMRHKTIKVKDVWKYDEYVINELKKQDYKVLVIWEFELRKELEKTTKKILKFVNS
tara:strand:+ start:201 stop:1274 length:1074 start_codon:yes stop_codon:yes gene_type:complete